MGFLSKIAEWCKQNIPILGGHIAYVIDEIQKHVEEWFKPWKDKLDSIDNWLSKTRKELDEFLSNPAEYIKNCVVNILDSIIRPLHRCILKRRN